MKKRRNYIKEIIACSLLFLGIHQASAHRSPSNCGGAGVGVQVFKFREDGVTVANTITNGERVIYQIQVQNNAVLGGPGGTPVCDVTCASVLFQCPDSSGNPGAPIVVATGINLPFGTAPFTIGSVTCTVSVASSITSARAHVDVIGVVHDLTIPGCTPDATCVTNSCDPDIGGGQQEVSVTVRTPCIHVTKQCVGAVNVGGNAVVVSFTGSVSNCGNETLVNVGITNNQPVAGTLVTNINSLAAGQSISFSGTYTNTSNICGPFPDTVTVTGTGVGSLGTVTDSASAQCTITYTPCIRVTKICNPAAPTSVLPGGTVTFSGVVTNCGNIALTNVVVTDTFLGGLIITIPRLEAGGLPGSSAPYTTNYVTTQQDCTRGIITNTVVASGINLCNSAVTVRDTNSCTFLVVCAPKICVTKEVACELPTGCGNYSDVATGVKTADNTQCPSFCYRVRVTNCGQEPLNNVTVVDNVINLAGCNFPTSLAVGQTVECIVAGVEHCQTVTNTVTASGVGSSSGIGVSTNDTAAVVVLPISITCNLTVNGKPNETIPCDGQGHLITNAVEVCNTGSLPLSDIAINAPDLVALGCTNVANLRLSLLPGQCTNLVLCTDLVTCPSSCGLAFSNHIRITATVDQTLTNVCSWTRNESNQVVAIEASTECTATVECLAPPKAGCTPGFWKNCTIHWQPTGYRTDQSVSSVFSLGSCCTSLGNSSLLGALSFGGGSSVCGGAQNLLRAAVAALLNASSPEVDYPISQQEVISMVSAALQSCNRDTMIALASELDRDNNLGCRDANGNDLPCHRLVDVPRAAPTR